MLHGGPGLPHDYLEPLADLAGDERAVVFYDQLGCGRSDHPDDDGLWTIETFVDEIDVVRAHLQIGPFDLLGHSWGGWLAQQYVLDRQPKELRRIVLASTCSSIPAFGRVTSALKATLPAEIQEVLDRHEETGTTDDPAYFEASLAYITQWLIRTDIPDYVLAAKAGQNEHIYNLMQGPEWNITGTLRDWDVTNRLSEIRQPVLVTSGSHDEMRPDLVSSMVDRLADVHWVLFESSAHMAHIEERDMFLSEVARFLEA